MYQDSRPNALKRVLPYMILANISISLAERAVKFIADGQHRNHRLSDSDIAHLRSGGEIHFTDSRGKVYRVRA